MEKPLYNIGSMTVPSVNTVGEKWAEVEIDSISTGEILICVVPDEVQRPDIIVGRSWLDSSIVVYYKYGNQLHLYRAEPVADMNETTITSLGKYSNYLHLVEVERDCTRTTENLKFLFCQPEGRRR